MPQKLFSEVKDDPSLLGKWPVVIAVDEGGTKTWKFENPVAPAGVPLSTPSPGFASGAHELESSLWVKYDSQTNELQELKEMAGQQRTG